MIGTAAAAAGAFAEDAAKPHPQPLVVIREHVGVAAVQEVGEPADERLVHLSDVPRPAGGGSSKANPSGGRDLAGKPS